MSQQAQNEVERECIAYLSNNAGQLHPVDRIAANTNYSEGYVREHLHGLAERSGTMVERERRDKEIFGVIIGNDFVPITSNRDDLLDIIQDYSPSDYDQAKSMSVNELQTLVESIADEVVTSSTDKLFFGIR